MGFLGGGGGGYLNLLTGQIIQKCQTFSDPRNEEVVWEDDFGLGLDPSDFFMKPDSFEGRKWNAFMDAVFKVASGRYRKPIKDFTSSFLDDL